MHLRVAWIGKTKERAIQSLTAEYLKRLARYIPAETMELASDGALLKMLDRSRGPQTLVMLDARGKQFSSEQFAEFLQKHQERGTQSLLFVVGGADGLTEQMRGAASCLLSLGPMTLPHELARVVLLEQLYRGFTILARHPYHTGHK